MLVCASRDLQRVARGGELGGRHVAGRRRERKCSVGSKGGAGARYYTGDLLLITTLSTVQ